MKKVAFTGTSGSGKTTLVKWVEKEFNLGHLNGSAGTIAKAQLDEIKLRHGYTGDGHLDVIKYSAINPVFGYEFQTAVLESRWREIADNEDFVTDRSPLDNLVYFATQTAWNKTSLVETITFESKCKLAMQELTHLIYIQPCQPNGIVEDNNSRIPNRLYQDAMDAVFQKFLYRFENIYPRPKLLIIDFWDLEDRKKLIKEFLRDNPELDLGV
jgi:hypothetical protein